MEPFAAVGKLFPRGVIPVSEAAHRTDRGHGHQFPCYAMRGPSSESGFGPSRYCEAVRAYHSDAHIFIGSRYPRPMGFFRISKNFFSAI